MIAAPAAERKEEKPAPGATATKKGPAPAAPGGKAPKGGGAEPYRISIEYFRKKVDLGTMSTGGGGAAPDSAAIELGDSIILCWCIKADSAAGSVSAQLTGVGGVEPGTRTTNPDGTVSYRGERTLSPATTTRFTLSASQGALGTSRTFAVNVQRPEFDVLDPEINQNTLECVFHMRNSGDGAFRSAPLDVDYEVAGFGGRSTFRIASGTLPVAPIAVNRGQRVRLGSISLADHRRELLYYDSLRLFVRVRSGAPQAVESRRENFAHSWTNRTFTLSPEMLSGLSTLSSCEVRLNNLLRRDGRVAAEWPVAVGDCLISLFIPGMREPFSQPFTIPANVYTVRVTGSLSGHEYLEERVTFFIDGITAQVRDRPDLLYIRDGKLGFHLEFPNTGRSEIKLGTVNAHHVFLDDEIGDIDIGSFTVDALLTPTIRDERISYSSIEVIVPTINASIVGRFDSLNSILRDYLRDFVTGQVRSQLSSILGSAAIKTAVENGLTGAMTSLPGGGGAFTHLVSLRGSGNTITVTYR